MSRTRVSRRFYWLSALTLLASCKKDAPAAPAASDAGASKPAPPVRANNTPNIDAGVGHTISTTRPEAPATLFVQVSGANLRRAIPMLFPEGRGQEATAVEQLAPRFTPGISGMANRVALDDPFAAVMTVSFEAKGPKQQMFVSWPLKAGSSVAQDARALRGWRDEGDGMYSPTSQDAGAGAENQCWVSQREPVGWMLLCGPRESLAQVAPYLRDQVNHPSPTSPILDLILNPSMYKRVAQLQMEQLDMQPAPTGETPMERLQRQALSQLRRDLKVRGALLSDATMVHLALTQDENQMHLRGEMQVPSIGSEDTRTLVTASTGRPAPTELLSMLPANVSAFYVQSFDNAGVEKVFGPSESDPSVVVRMGPEVAEVIAKIGLLSSFTSLGTRVTAYSPEDGGTLYHIIERPDAADAARFVTDLRAKLNSIPPKPVAPGTIITLRDVFALLPSTIEGSDSVRIGKRMPPGVPEDQRAAFEISTLVVPVGNKLIAIVAKDPVARFKAMSQGARFAYTMPADSPIAGRVTPEAFLQIVFGESRQATDSAGEPLEFSLSIKPQGSGAMVSLNADASIGSANQIRYLYAAYTAQIEQQQQAAAQMQNGGGQPGAPPPGEMPGPVPQPAQ